MQKQVGSNFSSDHDMTNICKLIDPTGNEFCLICAVATLDVHLLHKFIRLHGATNKKNNTRIMASLTWQPK